MIRGRDRDQGSGTRLVGLAADDRIVEVDWQGKIIFNTLDGQTIALDANSGKLRWRIFAWDPRGADPARLAYYRNVETEMPGEPDMRDIVYPDIRLVYSGTDKLKDEVTLGLTRNEPGPGAYHLSKHLDDRESEDLALSAWLNGLTGASYDPQQPRKHRVP